MKLKKIRRGNRVRLHIWGTFWDDYEYPQIHLTRREAREAARHLHVIRGHARKVIVEWCEKKK